jgi:hypothetical protein
MVNLPFVPSAIRCFDSPELEVLQLSVFSEAPTHLNSDRGEKLRGEEWLISAILREINHLDGIGEAEPSAVCHLERSRDGTKCSLGGAEGPLHSRPRGTRSGN